MFKLTAEEIGECYDKFMEVIDDTFEGERKNNLIKMYEHFGDRLLLAPASGKDHFHLAVPGGYLKHCLNIIDISDKMAKMYRHVGGTTDFTEEERIFAAMHHDLGKLGDYNHDYYIPVSQDWQIKRGIRYEYNPDLNFMDVTDRSLFLLQQFDIKITDNEMYGIRLADGMFKELNKSYFNTYTDAMQMKNHLPFIIHWADWMATRMEYDTRMNVVNLETKQEKKAINSIKESLTKPKVESKKPKTKVDPMATFTEIFEGMEK
jgi:hypothetical protein